MIAQGDFQKLLLAGTAERGEIFRKIFHTGLYQELQNKLKDAVKDRWKEYDEIRRSINQYLSGAVCTDEPDLALELDALKKAKFEGKVERGLELLKSIIERDSISIKELEAKGKELEQKIQEEDQLLGKAKQSRQLKTELEKKQDALKVLLPRLEESAALRKEKQAAAADGDRLTTQIQQGTEKLKMHKKLLEDKALAKSMDERIQEADDKQTAKEDELSGLRADTEKKQVQLAELKDVGEEKARLAYEKEKLARCKAEIGELLQSLGQMEETFAQLSESLSTEQEKKEGLNCSIDSLEEEIDKRKDKDAVLVSIRARQDDLNRRKSSLLQSREDWVSGKGVIEECTVALSVLDNKKEQILADETKVKDRREGLKGSAEEKLKCFHHIEELQQKKRSFEELCEELKTVYTLAAQAEAGQQELLEQKKEKEEHFQKHQEKWQQVKNADLHLARLEQEKAELASRKQQVEKILQSGRDLESLNSELQEKQEAYRASALRKDALRDSYQELEGMFLDAQAGMLALRLIKGQECPVCGSTHHPCPAVLPEKVPDKKELDKKRKELTKAEAEAGQLSADARHLLELTEKKKEEITAQGREILKGAMKDPLKENLKGTSKESSEDPSKKITDIEGVELPDIIELMQLERTRLTTREAARMQEVVR